VIWANLDLDVQIARRTAENHRDVVRASRRNATTDETADEMTAAGTFE
jgi:hypothetical protein